MNIHFKTAFDYIRRSPFQALAAVLVLGLTFFASTILALLVYSSSQVLNYFETRPQVIAFLKDSAKSEEIALLQNKLTNDPKVKEVKYVTKEEALGIYKKATSGNPLLSELVNPSIFPASLEFSLKNLSFANELVETIKKEPIVSEVGFTASLGGETKLEDVISRLKRVTWYLRLGGGVLVGVLGITSFFVLLVIIGMRISTRKSEVEILNLIGATPGFIRSPILIESALYSLTGVLIGWITALVLVLYLAPSIVSYFGDIPTLPKATVNFLSLFGIFLAGEIIIALTLALFGSMLAISRARREK